MALRVKITAAEIEAALRRMAGQLLERFGAQQEVLVVALLNGATWFAADLLRMLPANFVLETVRVGSYGDARESGGSLEWRSPVPDCAGRRVLLLDDVLDTGITLQAVAAELRRRGAAGLVTAVVVDKQGRRRVPVQADYAAFRLGDAYLVGYGMDDAGRYRNLPYIAEVVDS